MTKGNASRSGVFYYVALSLLSLTILQTADAKEKPTAAAESIPKGAMALFGYPGATVLHHAITDEGIHNFVFSTPDPIEKVAAHYEKYTFFIDSVPFQKELRDHPQAGKFLDSQNGNRIFYYRNVLGGLCYYAVATDAGLTEAATITTANGVTIIKFHSNNFRRKRSQSAK